MAVLMLAAMSLGQAQVPITLEQGWNWISYPYSEPMTIEAALSGFTPAEGDILKSQTSMAQYQNGSWSGNLTTLIPGEGYMYQSADGIVKSFIFGGTANDPSGLPEEALTGEFKVASNGTKVRFSPGNLQCRINPNQETQAIVGTGTSTTAYMPYNTFYCYSLCQMIYKAEELVTAGLSAGSITGIAFESYSDLHYLRNGITVWMAPTTLTEAPSTSVSTSGMTQVFSGSLIQQDGWTPIYFNMPFTWDGTSDLMVTVLMNHGSYSNPYIYWQCSNAGFTCSSYKYTDSNAYNPGSSTYSMNTTSNRPNTRFNGKGSVTWRFAEQQWDYIGANNACASGSYKGWIDLFGWGTSGHLHGANSYQPWSTSGTSGDYYAYGTAGNSLFDQTGEADWGSNAVSNGGDQPNQWRALTTEEWDYLLNTRSGKRFAKAKVNGVKGLIVLPDGWKTSYYSLSETNNAEASYSSNVVTADQWQTLEQHGAVFLPAAGMRNQGTASYANSRGYYWTSSSYNNGNASCVKFTDAASSVGYSPKYYGSSVRLVCQSNPRIRTLGVSGVTTTGAMVSAEADFTGTVGSRGICWSTTAAPTYDDNHAAAGSGKGSFSKELTGLQPNTTYHVRAYAKISSVYRYGNELTFTTADDCINGHAYVDLGLPSGLLWATCNMGADTPEDYGNYYAWGETTTKSGYSWSTYQYCNGSDNTLTKYCTNSSYGYNGFVDNLTALLPEDDVATANWGGNWRMPTKEEWQELLDNTTNTWTQQNGVNGRLFTASNGNSIFLPAAGYRYNSSLYIAGSYGFYWSSSLYTDYPCYAWILGFLSDNYYLHNSSRDYGHSVRPVHSSGQN